MPYSIGERGSYGCDGYPVVKDGTSDVMGCHESREAAANQIAAIEANENKDVGIKDPQAWPGTKKTEGRMGQPFPASNRSSLFRTPRKNPRRRVGGVGGDSAGAVATTGGGTGMGTKATPYMSNPAPIPETSGFRDERETRNRISEEVGKEHGKIKEGDFVMGETTEGVVHGIVEHIMWEGGTLGTPGSDYAITSMPPENPAMSVRLYEQDMQEDWVPTAYSIGMMYTDATVVDMEEHSMGKGDDLEEIEYMAKKSPCWKGYRQEGMKPGSNGSMVPNCVPVKKWLDSMEKAESYSPNDGMKSAARRALQWKEDGKAKGAGTAVGWGRARDIVAGRSMSLSVVKRMYSFFSRHEVDKEAEGFSSGEEGYPSKGRVMWDAWGGDAGFSWSKSIAERNEDKALFSNFGKDFTRASRLTEVFKAESVRVGQMVSWNSSGGTARGKVKRIITDGAYKVPGTDVTVTGTKEEPAAVITLYRDGEPTDTIVAHKVKTLRASQKPSKGSRGTLVYPSIAFGGREGNRTPVQTSL